MATWIVAHLDKNGVFYGDAAMVRSQVFPLEDIPLTTVEEYLVAMEQALDEDGNPLILRFRARGRLWQFWPGFDRNQPGLRKEKERTEFAEPPEQWRQAGAHVPADCPPTAGQLPADCPPTAGQLPADCPPTAGQLPADCPPTAGQLPASGRTPDGKSPAEQNGTEQQNRTEQEQNTTEQRASAPAVVAAPSIVALLCDANVSKEMAAKLAAAHPLSRVQEVIEAARNGERGPGWIVDALRGDWDVGTPTPRKKRKGGNGSRPGSFASAEDRRAYYASEGVTT